MSIVDVDTIFISHSDTALFSDDTDLHDAGIHDETIRRPTNSRLLRLTVADSLHLHEMFGLYTNQSNHTPYMQGILHFYTNSLTSNDGKLYQRAFAPNDILRH